MYEVTVEETFAAGHALRNYHGKCENVHGHNYRASVTVEGHLQADDYVFNFVTLKRLMRTLVDQLADHLPSDAIVVTKSTVPVGTLPDGIAFPDAITLNAASMELTVTATNSEFRAAGQRP